MAKSLFRDEAFQGEEKSAQKTDHPVSAQQFRPILPASGIPVPVRNILPRRKDLEWLHHELVGLQRAIVLGTLLPLGPLKLSLPRLTVAP